MKNDRDYDIEILKQNSIGKHKRKKIHGSLYPFKGITLTPDFLRGFLATIGLAAVLGGMLPAARRVEIVDNYKRILKQEAEAELTSGYAKDFLAQDSSKKGLYDNYKEAKEELDPDDYKRNGDRKDGTHNELIKDDPGSIIHLYDNEKDAIVKAVDDQIYEYIEEHEGSKKGRK